MLQQVLLPMRSDSRAHTCCTPPTSALYLCHAGHLPQLDVHARAISAQTAEHSLVKVHACMHIAKAGQRPTDAELGALHHQATPTMQHVARSTYGYVRCAPSLSCS
jgi:hypothetical protein